MLTSYYDPYLGLFAPSTKCVVAKLIIQLTSRVLHAHAYYAPFNFPWIQRPEIRHHLQPYLARHYAAAAIANVQARKPSSEQTKRVPNPAGSRAELHPSAVKSHVSVELAQPHSHPERVPLNRLMTTCPPSARPSLTNYLLYEGSTAARLEPASEKKKKRRKQVSNFWPNCRRKSREARNSSIHRHFLLISPASPLTLSDK